MEIRQFDENGFPEFQRSLGQNNHYWGFVVGQCVFWHRIFYNRTGDVSYDFQGTDEQLAMLYHNRFKKFVLIPIFHKESTQNLIESEYLEYVAEIDLYLAEKKIDVFQFGSKGKV